MKILHNFERFYVVAVMIFLSGAGVAGRVGAGGTAPAPQLWQNYGRLLVCATLAPLLLLHFRQVMEGVRHSGWLIALCGLAGASCLWAHDPRFVVRHAIFVCVVTMFGIYIATCFEWEEQLNLFGWTMVLVVVSSGIVAAFIPSYGLSHDLHTGAVKGIYPQKNHFGAMMSFSIITFLFARPKGVPNILKIATVIGSAVLLILASSATAIVALVGCLACYPLWLLFKSSKTNNFLLWVAALPVVGIGLVLATANFDIVAKLAGRSATLSDRIPLWNGILGAIAKRPWFGYGFDIFWLEWSQDLYKIVYVMTGWHPPHAHNGYLDIVLSMGIVGLVVFMVGFIINVWRAGKLSKVSGVYAANWPFFVLLFFGIVNLAESFILRLMSFFWIPYVAIYVSSALLLEQAQTEEFSDEVAETIATDDGGHVNGALPGYST
jgi:exopolysaccharide production protein ExoQ